MNARRQFQAPSICSAIGDTSFYSNSQLTHLSFFRPPSSSSSALCCPLFCCPLFHRPVYLALIYRGLDGQEEEAETHRKEDHWGYFNLCATWSFWTSCSCVPPSVARTSSLRISLSIDRTTDFRPTVTQTNNLCACHLQEAVRPDLTTLVTGNTEQRVARTRNCTATSGRRESTKLWFNAMEEKTGDK